MPVEESVGGTKRSQLGYLLFFLLINFYYLHFIQDFTLRGLLLVCFANRVIVRVQGLTLLFNHSTLWADPYSGLAKDS